MPELFWVHAFRREVTEVDGTVRADEEAIVRVLHDGPKVHPNSANDTRVYEQRLGIVPPRVYAYVGRTLETFGENAVVLPQLAIRAGQLSPFDTGGTIKKIKPVDSFSDPDKAAYVAAFTWTIPDDLADCLAKYPSYDPEPLAAYLDTTKPGGRGPCDLWPGRHEAAIWEENSDWRAWTWEGRAEPHHVAMAELRHWTCPPAIEHAVFDAATRLYKATDREFLVRLRATYFQGGVGTLLGQLRKDQAA